MEQMSTTLERNEVSSSNMEQLLKFKLNFKKSPESIAFALRNDKKTKETISCIVWPEKYEAISKQNPVKKNPNSLSEDINTREIQSLIYKELNIDVNTDSNGAIKKFIKWAIDSLIIGNVELVMKIKEKGITDFLMLIKNQLTTIEGWKNIATSLWKTVTELFSCDAYKTWKSVAELGLVTIWAWAAWWGLKKMWKSVIHSAEKIGAETVKWKIISTTLKETWWVLENTWKVLQVPLKTGEKITKWIGKWIAYAGEKVWVNKVIRHGIEKWKDVIEKTWVWEVIKKTKDATKQIIWVIGTAHVVWNIDWPTKHPKFNQTWAIFPEWSPKIKLHEWVDIVKLAEKCLTKEEIKFVNEKYFSGNIEKNLQAKVGLENFVNRGNNGVIFEIPDKDQVIKLPVNKENLATLQREMLRHDIFQDELDTIKRWYWKMLQESR